MAFDFLAGCLGGCAGVLVGHPFDTVKVHLQTQDVNNPKYKGTFHCFKTIAAQHSLTGLYRGVSSPMGGVAFVNAIVFGTYGNIQRNTKDPSSLSSHFMAGSVAGLIQSFVCSPMELAKTRLQLQNNYSGVRHKGPIQCLSQIYRSEGLRGVFRGLVITALRDIPGFSTYFISYELLTRDSSPPTSLQALLAGGLAGTISWLVSFPMDVVKSRIQADGINGRRKFTGITDCIRQGYKTEGLSFCTKGLTSTLIRAFPMNAACFFVVSWIMKFSNKINFVEFELHKPKSIAMVSSIPAASTSSQFNFFEQHIPLSSSHDHENIELCRRKLHMVKSLIFLGALNEGVCSSEIIELANDLYDDQDFHLSVISNSSSKVKKAKNSE